MKKILFSWIGSRDVNSLGVGNEIGPLRRSIEYLGSQIDEVVAIYNDLGESANFSVEDYVHKIDAESKLFHPEEVEIENPTDHSEIYRTVVPILEKHYSADSEFIFHLSSGTPSMATIWAVISRTLFPAKLLNTQRDEFLWVDLPWEMREPAYRRFEKEYVDSFVAAEENYPDDSTDPFGGIVHSCESMSNVISRARRAALFEVPVLIEGESGTGKELLSRAVHSGSPYSNRELEIVNCGAIPESLIEATLFGHIKGAFTGATKDQKGIFELASNGTVFLDEIGELSLESQKVLLRVLNEKTFRPVGGNKDLEFRGRVIAATNKDLRQEVEAGRFREDLYYRLAVAVVKIPPLRDRGNDVVYIAEKIWKEIEASFRDNPMHKTRILSKGALSAIRSYGWPGNVRELRNALYRAYLWAENERVTAGDLGIEISRQPNNGRARLYQPDDLNVYEALRATKKSYVEAALKQAKNNRAKAAKLLGMANSVTLRNWMIDLEIL